jgi:hypothetical protein
MLEASRHASGDQGIGNIRGRFTLVGARNLQQAPPIFDAKRMQNHAMKALQGGFG